MSTGVTYKVGIVGAGFGARVHLPAFAAHPKFEVAAIASPSKARDIAAQRNIPHAFASCEEMLQGCDLDVVSVASPPFMHHADVLAALDARKHVICEKPLALNVAQAQAMLTAARDAGTAAAVMHEFRWIPQRIALKELVENGHLHPLREIEIAQLTGTLRADRAERHRGWWFSRESGGGMAGAILSHAIDAANWFAGRPPLRVNGFIRTANTLRRDSSGPFESTVDDGAFALLDYGEGLVARLAVDATVAVDSSTYALHAENRTAVASGTLPHELRLFSIDEDETSELECTPSPYYKFAAVDPLVPYVMQLLDAFALQIETGSSKVPTFEDALHTQRVLEAIGFGERPV